MRSVLYKFSPFTWPERVIKIITAAFFIITVPIYLFIGLQPATAADPNLLDYDSLSVPEINLNTQVKPLSLNENNELIAPDTIAGAYSRATNKTLIIGHSTTVFQNLKSIKQSDIITYDNQNYTVTNIATLAKPDISMNEILSAANRPTIILMTCAGEPLGGQDFTHRLIITATLNS